MHIDLETDRLILRRFTPADVDLLVELDSDPAVLRYINGGVPTPRTVVEQNILPRFLRSYRAGYGYWAAHERATGAFIGWFALHPEEDGEPDDIALGYRLRRAAWGQGYGTEGARALVAYGFTRLGMRRVFAVTYEHNLGSRRVMEKAGLRLVRRYRPTPEDLAAGGTFVFTGEVWDGDDVEYALTRAEWTQ